MFLELSETGSFARIAMEIGRVFIQRLEGYRYEMPNQLLGPTLSSAAGAQYDLLHANDHDAV